MAGNGCWGQSSQGLCLPQAFQELSSEVTVTVLVSEETILVRASLSGNLIGSGVWMHGVTKDISLRGSAVFGGISTMTDSVKIRTCGGRLSWLHTLAEPSGIQGGATGI